MRKKTSNKHTQYITFMLFFKKSLLNNIPSNETEKLTKVVIVNKEYNKTFDVTSLMFKSMTPIKTMIVKYHTFPKIIRITEHTIFMFTALFSLKVILT